MTIDDNEECYLEPIELIELGPDNVSEDNEAEVVAPSRSSSSKIKVKLRSKRPQSLGL
jgi:hypothetical protein